MENQDLSGAIHAVDNFGESLRLIGESMRGMMHPFLHTIQLRSEQVTLEWIESHSRIDWTAAVRDLSDKLNIEFGNWEAVSPEAFDRITPEQRWEYQKWVWGAPKRWVIGLVERYERWKYPLLTVKGFDKPE